MFVWSRGVDCVLCFVGCCRFVFLWMNVRVVLLNRRVHQGMTYLRPSKEHTPLDVFSTAIARCFLFPPHASTFFFAPLSAVGPRSVQMEKIRRMMRNDPTLKFLEIGNTGERAAANDANFVAVLQIWGWVVAFSSFVVFRLFFLGCTLLNTCVLLV